MKYMYGCSGVGKSLGENERRGCFKWQNRTLEKFECLVGTLLQ